MNTLEFSKVSIAWTNLQNKMMEEKAGVNSEKQNSKKGFQKNEHACSVDGLPFSGKSKLV